MNEMLQFEKEKCRDLRRFPMYFRLKLDLCGIKLSKRDWNSFPLAEKEKLLAMPCETRAQIAAFREGLKTLIRESNGDSVEFSDSAADMQYPWRIKTAVPDRVREQILHIVKEEANLDRWADLSDLQRFALIKLTEPGKTKPALLQVLQEFCLLPMQDPLVP
jgi:hypothetical protein